MLIISNQSYPLVSYSLAGTHQIEIISQGVGPTYLISFLVLGESEGNGTNTTFVIDPPVDLASNYFTVNEDTVSCGLCPDSRGCHAGYFVVRISVFAGCGVGLAEREEEQMNAIFALFLPLIVLIALASTLIVLADVLMDIAERFLW